MKSPKDAAGGASGGDPAHRWLDGFGRVLKFIVPIAVSAGMIVWLFDKVNLHQIKEIISRGVDYRYLAIMMCLTVLSHVIRGIRWGIQLRAFRASLFLLKASRFSGPML